MSLKNKIALITGSSRGLGKDTALSLAKKGCDIIVTYNSNKDSAKDVLKELHDIDVKAVSLQLDVSKTSSFESFYENIKSILKENWGRENIDFLINNAGVGAHTPIGKTEEEVFDNLYNIHLKGVYFLTQTLLPLISDNGRIINVSTGLTRFSFPGYAAYASMKGAIEVFTRYLAKELGSRGITANTIAPGAIDNDFNKDAFNAHPQVKNIISQNTALGRVGVSEDIGGVVAFLCSEEAGWVNAQRIEISGGMFI